jgi:hypothetical protein
MTDPHPQTMATPATGAAGVTRMGSKTGWASWLPSGASRGVSR